IRRPPSWSTSPRGSEWAGRPSRSGRSGFDDVDSNSDAAHHLAALVALHEVEDSRLAGFASGGDPEPQSNQHLSLRGKRDRDAGRLTPRERNPGNAVEEASHAAGDRERRE